MRTHTHIFMCVYIYFHYETQKKEKHNTRQARRQTRKNLDMTVQGIWALLCPQPSERKQKRIGKKRIIPHAVRNWTLNKLAQKIWTWKLHPKVVVQVQCSMYNCSTQIVWQSGSGVCYWKLSLENVSSYDITMMTFASCELENANVLEGAQSD